MIKTPEKINIPTMSADRSEIVCNWREGVCGDYLKLRVNEGKEILMERSAFLKAAIMLGNEEEQEDMIPFKRINIRSYCKKVVVRLVKNMKKGDLLTIPVNFDIPLNEETLPVLNLNRN